MAEVVLHRAALQQLLSSPSGAVGVWLFAKGRRIESMAKQLCPVDHGALRASIRTEPPVPLAGRLTCLVGSSLNYARFVHDGTGIYGRGSPIRPVRAKFLRFQPKGGGANAPFVFAKQVSGSRGQPFLRDALAAVWR